MGFSRKEAPNCDWCPARKNCFYSFLDNPSKLTWRRMRIARRFRAGEALFYEGEKPTGIYVVCTGKVKIYKSTQAGQQLLTRIESPGDLVGHISMLADWDYAGSVEAMAESIVSFIEKEEFMKFLASHPKASLALLHEIARDVRRGEARARDIAFKPAKSRLAGTLLRSMDERARPALVRAFKRRELAEMSGLSVETTVRLLKEFEDRGLTKRRDKDILIIDREKLRELSGHFS